MGSRLNPHRVSAGTTCAITAPFAVCVGISVAVVLESEHFAVDRRSFGAQYPDIRCNCQCEAVSAMGVHRWFCYCWRNADNGDTAGSPVAPDAHRSVL